MKYVKCVLLALPLIAVTACHQDEIDELESEVYQLRKENAALKSHITDLENEIANYDSYMSKYSAQQEQRSRHMRNVQTYLNSAEFARQNGNEWLYESEMRNAQSELDMMP